MPDTDIDTARLARIEAQLTDDALTDDELCAELSAAGLPELARVLAQRTGGAR